MVGERGEGLRVRYAAAAIGISLLLAACGTPQREPNVLDRAAARAAAVASARSESVSVMSWGGETMTVRSTGVHDYLRDRLAMTYESEVGGERHVSRFVAIGSVTYFEWEQGTDTPFPAGKRWVRFSFADYDEEAHACDSGVRTSLESEGNGPFGDLEWEEPLPEERDDVSTIDSSVGISMYYLADTEPSETLDTLRELGSEITVVGRELLRNRPMTHYRARLDQREALRHELKKSGWKDESIACALADMPETTDLVEVWIDDDGLVHRTVTTSTWDLSTWDVDEPTRTVETTVETTDYFDFGAAVTIEPPPADQVVDEADLRDAYEG